LFLGVSALSSGLGKRAPQSNSNIPNSFSTADQGRPFTFFNRSSSSALQNSLSVQHYNDNGLGFWKLDNQASMNRHRLNELQGTVCDFDKENKIRIVEKLGTMKSALSQEYPLEDGHALNKYSANSGSNMEEISSSAASPVFSKPVKNDIEAYQPKLGTANDSMGNLSTNVSFGFVFREPDNAGVNINSEAGMNVKWLNDQELSELTTEELEIIMDRYIMEVVKQLVQLAALDEDLKAEIDSLDSSGFSLLHYCCLYNLTSLVPVLIAKGANVNKRTGNGSTALHLAAGAGHLAVAEVLVQSGAVVTTFDANNVLPSDAAYNAGYAEIYNMLLLV
jgi:hypothetical protein